MNIAVAVDTRPAETYLGGVHRKQIPFAASKALNDTAKQAQKAVRANLAATFILRRPDFILREGAKIPQFSTKERLEVELQVSRRADMLGKFEKGGEKRPTRSRNLVIPAAARPSIRDVLPTHLRPRKLRLRPHGTSGNVLVGRHRTFLIKDKGLFQRTGPGRSDVILLFSMTPRARVTASLHFEDITRRVIRESWPEHFARAFALAVRTAK